MSTDKKSPRRHNLSYYLRKFIFENHTNVKTLAKEIGIPQTTLNRIAEGSTKRPHPKTKNLLEQFLGISQDSPSGSDHREVTQKNNQIIHVPLFKMKDITTSEFHKLLSSTEKIMVPASFGHNTFATEMPNSSMEPLFSEGTTLIFNSDLKANDKDYVLVYLHKKKTTIFRKLLIDPDLQYLEPINPHLSSTPLTVLEANDLILGTLIEARRNYYNKLILEKD